MPTVKRPLKPQAPRKGRVTVRLADEERALLQRRAAEQGKDISAYLRDKGLAS
jgi:uncharacterized protein (DUF1778 family)